MGVRAVSFPSVALLLCVLLPGGGGNRLNPKKAPIRDPTRGATPHATSGISTSA